MVTMIPRTEKLIPTIINLGKLQEHGAKLRLSLQEVTSIRFALERLNVSRDLFGWSFRTLLMENKPVFKWLLQLVPVLIMENNADAAKLLVFTWFQAKGDPNKFAKILAGVNFTTHDRWRRMQLPREILA